ncbi:Os01g0622033 [Oryza sativa Japonica Group]|uniref:Os01g0622033 protein n=1 Tax=Oryza sativa subsp. japonica TaxID=39947 RepID=A0A0P0V5H4_ORYSJ|nr:hypothetical protein EE612_004141 [Oryza sativa]BAS73219.1 Os01g0622033 [Oryza sativa Japonica Group]
MVSEAIRFLAWTFPADAIFCPRTDIFPFDTACNRTCVNLPMFLLGKRSAFIPSSIYFLIISRSGAITSFSRHIAWTSTLGKDCSLRQEPYITRSDIPRRLSLSSEATCSTAPLGKPTFKETASRAILCFSVTFSAKILTLSSSCVLFSEGYCCNRDPTACKTSASSIKKPPYEN